jgi:hypothetical protein
MTLIALLLDVNCGQTILTDRKKVQQAMEFLWQRDAKGATEIFIRSRKSIFPHWDSEEFTF